ncbi:MAG: hypothetical protein AAFW73_11750 [Bacteroidota bacterium]
MVLELSKDFVHSACAKTTTKRSEAEMRQLLLQLMQSSGIDPDKIVEKREGILELKDDPKIKLHSLMLRAEEMGLEIKYTKKTLIEIC